MPVIKSAIKKLRQDKKAEKRNDVIRSEMKKALHTAYKQKKAEVVSKAFSSLDKAVKKHIIHKNKAARLKSQLSTLLVKSA